MTIFNTVFNKTQTRTVVKFYSITNSIFLKNRLEFHNANYVIIQNSMFFKNYIEFGETPSETDTIAYINNCIIEPLTDFIGSSGSEFLLPIRALLVKAKNCIFTDSLFYHTTPAAYIPVTGPDMQVGINPLFLDTFSGNLHLRPCSPAWNAGNNASTIALGLATDLDGQPRIADGQVDIGPYEIQPLINVGPGIVQTACFNQPQGAVQWNLQNGCPPYTYYWSKGGNTGTTTSGLSPGNYQFTITDSRGRTLLQNAQIPTSAPQLSLSGDTLICPASNDGDLLAMVSGAMLPLTYHWSNGSSEESINNLSLGTYSATVTDAIGCKDTATAKILPYSVPIGLVVQTGLASTLTTADGSLQITVQNGQPPYTYAWGEVASTSPAIFGLLPGIYHLSITDGAGCITPVQFEVGVVSATASPEALVPGSVQPNPARGQALLRFGDSTRWQLFSVTGVELLRVEGPAVGQEVKVDLSGLPVGLYFYTFSDQGKVVSQDRLFVLGK